MLDDEGNGRHIHTTKLRLQCISSENIINDAHSTAVQSVQTDALMLKKRSRIHGRIGGQYTSTESELSHEETQEEKRKGKRED